MTLFRIVSGGCRSAKNLEEYLGQAVGEAIGATLNCQFLVDRFVVLTCLHHFIFVTTHADFDTCGVKASYSRTYTLPQDAKAIAQALDHCLTICNDRNAKKLRGRNQSSVKEGLLDHDDDDTSSTKRKRNADGSTGEGEGKQSRPRSGSRGGARGGKASKRGRGRQGGSRRPVKETKDMKVEYDNIDGADSVCTNESEDLTWDSSKFLKLAEEYLCEQRRQNLHCMTYDRRDFDAFAELP